MYQWRRQNFRQRVRRFCSFPSFLYAHNPCSFDSIQYKNVTGSKCHLVYGHATDLYRYENSSMYYGLRRAVVAVVKQSIKLTYGNTCHVGKTAESVHRQATCLYITVSWRHNFHFIVWREVSSSVSLIKPIDRVVPQHAVVVLGVRYKITRSTRGG